MTKEQKISLLETVGKTITGVEFDEKQLTITVKDVYTGDVTAITIWDD